MSTKIKKEAQGFVEVRINYDRVLLMPIEEGLELLRLINEGQWFTQTWASSSSQEYKKIEPDITFSFRKPDWLEQILLNNMISTEE